MVPETADPELRRHLAEVIATGEPYEDLRLDAGGRWLESKAYPVPDGVLLVIADVTERHAADAACREHEGLLQLMMDAVPALISYVDTDFRYRLANRTYETWFGHSPAEIRGRFVADVIGERSWQNVKPRIERALRGQSVTYDDDVCCCEGSTRAVRATYAPDFDASGRVRGVAVLVYDVTDMRRAEDALRQSELLLARAQEMAHVGCWEAEILDPSDQDRNTAKWSDETYRIFGYEPGAVEVTHQLFLAHIHPDDRDRVFAVIAQAMCNPSPYEIDYRILRPDGSERVVHEWALTECDAAGRPKRMIGTAQDVTEQRRAQQALLDADRRKDEFLATLAHELRNPLATLRNALEILAMPGPDVASRQRARTLMERQMHHLVRLVDDLLDVSRMMQGKITLRRQRVDVATAVARALDTVESMLDSRGHELRVDLPREPLEVDADPIRLSQVIANLLSNAARYTPAHGHVELTAAREGDRAVVRVRDDGVGIPAELLPRVFDLFFQASSPSGGEAGIGVGLTLVKRLVEMHGGTVEARSAGPGRGSEFVVRLPLLQDARGAAEPGGETRPAPAAARRRRILVVDDNSDSAESLALLLSLQGHATRIALGGEQALEIARAFAPEIVFLDLGMPGMNGYEVARHLRRKKETEHAVLVALTGWGQEEHRRRSAQAGFDRHVVKPVDLDVLGALLEDLG